MHTYYVIYLQQHCRLSRQPPPEWAALSLPGFLGDKLLCIGSYLKIYSFAKHQETVLSFLNQPQTLHVKHTENRELPGLPIAHVPKKRYSRLPKSLWGQVTETTFPVRPSNRGLFSFGGDCNLVSFELQEEL